MEPLAGLADWEVTMRLAQALGYPMHYAHPSEIMDEIARLTPTFTGVSYEKLDRLGSIQWPCNEKAPEGTPTMHVGSFVRGKGKFYLTEYVATAERSTSRYPLLLTTGRVLYQYNVGTQTRRTKNLVFNKEDVLEMHPHDAEVRGIKARRPGRRREPRRRDRAARDADQAHRPRRRLHHVPLPGVRRQPRDHRELGLGDQLPGVQGDGRGGREGHAAGRLARTRTCDAHHPQGCVGFRRLRAPRAMNVQRLVVMANDIANFFGSDPDAAAAAEQVAGHMKKFWEPRMREELRRHVSSRRRGHVFDRDPGRQAARVARLRPHWRAHCAGGTPERAQKLGASEESRRRRQGNRRISPNHARDKRIDLSWEPDLEAGVDLGVAREVEGHGPLRDVADVEAVERLAGRA